jgi:glycosyltransferase involved in cell wall biosynthesis
MENSEKPKALMLASVASMIDLFNADNINILLKLGYEVDVATNFEFGSITSQSRVNEYKKELLERGIGVYHVPITRSLSEVKDIVASYKIVKRLADNKHYKIVHCHSPIGGVICRMAFRKARRKYGTKVIYTAHGFHFFKGASKKAWAFFYPIEKFCSRYTDLIITINQEDYNNAQKFHCKRVEYVPGIGIHTEEFRNVKIDKHAKRLELGFDDDDFIFMSTGQLSVRKNHEVVIRALAQIDNPKVKYLIVGFGELEDKLKSLANELNIRERVVFADYRGDVKELLHAVDAYAFPSRQEGLPVALMEAMAVGLPVVCSRIRGNVDLIENGKGGYLYECNDVDGFAKGMCKIAAGAGKDMGAVNIEVMRKFDTDVVNERMEKIYYLM